MNKTTNRQMFREGPTQLSGPVSNDLPRPVPLVPVAKPRGKTQAGVGLSSASNGFGVNPQLGPPKNNNSYNPNNYNNRTGDGDAEMITNGNHSVSPVKSNKNVVSSTVINGRKMERKSDNTSVVVADSVDEVVTYQNASGVSPTSVNLPNAANQQKRRPAPPPRDTDTMTKTKAILNEAADAVAKSFAKQTQGINKGNLEIFGK